MAGLLDRLESVRPAADCLYAFPNRDTRAYTARAFKTLWQRCVMAAISAGALPIESRFTFHDLRAFYASKHKRDHGCLPDLHANPQTTARVYDRNTELKRRGL